MKTITISLLAAMLTCSHALAIGFDPCIVLGDTSFSPSHPGPADRVGYNVLIPGDLAFPGAHDLWVKAIVQAGGRIDIEVLLKDGRSLESSAYRTVNRNYIDDGFFDHFGPLTPGDYTVVVDVRFYDPVSGDFIRICSGVIPRTVPLVIGAEAAAVAMAPVVEFFNAERDHYFITQAPAEIGDLDSGVHPGWSRTGQAFSAYVANQSDNRGRPACRFYGLPAYGVDTHFFTVIDSECRGLVDSIAAGSAPWQLETHGAFELALPDTTTGKCDAGTIPLYRMWSGRPDNGHRYTTDAAIRDQMVGMGYIPEGFGPQAVAMCAPQ